MGRKELAQIDLHHWDRSTTEECEELALIVGKELPPMFRFARLETHTLGKQHHRVAFYSWTPSGIDYDKQVREFALIPGGSVTLGYDRAQGFIPTSSQLQSWQQETMDPEKYGYTYSLETYLDRVLTPLRQVEIKPFLLETVTDSHNDVLNYDGVHWVNPYSSSDKAALQAPQIKDDFRLPTSDEWEYACGAGARTLFRWGDETPDMPIKRRAEAQVASGDWDFYARPNAFGLMIANDPFRWEFCDSPGIMRGGDQGMAMQSSMGIFAEWTTLATAYHLNVVQNLAPGKLYYAHLRRAFSLA